MKSGIIKDFDKFKEVSESDMSLLSWISGQAGNVMGKAVRERVTSMVLEWAGVPPADPNNPEGKGEWIREVFVKTISHVTLPEMDEFIKGKAINDSKFWAEKMSKALKEQLVDSGPRTSDVVNFLGVTPDGFIGRMIANMYREYILDEKKLEQTIIGLFNLVTKEEFIPQEDAGEVYKKAFAQLTPEQKERAEGSVWQSSVEQSDFLKRKGG